MAFVYVVEMRARARHANVEPLAAEDVVAVIRDAEPPVRRKASGADGGEHAGAMFGPRIGERSNEHVTRDAAKDVELKVHGAASASLLYFVRA
jgi:hypothetical protein